jgi:hypothetical protein
MSFDLTIDRIGTLVGSARGSNSPNLTDVDEIAAKFREQANKLYRDSAFAAASTEASQAAIRISASVYVRVGGSNA